MICLRDNLSPMQRDTLTTAMDSMLRAAAAANHAMKILQNGALAFEQETETLINAAEQLKQLLER